MKNTRVLFTFLPLLTATVLSLAPPVLSISMEPAQDRGSRSSGQSRSSTPSRSSSQSRGGSRKPQPAPQRAPQRTPPRTPKPAPRTPQRTPSRPQPQVQPRTTSTPKVTFVPPRVNQPAPTQPRTSAPKTPTRINPTPSIKPTTPDATGEAYIPSQRASRPSFPVPSTSGRTTYSRRFNGTLSLNGKATSKTGGTLGKRGRGSVTSAIEALKRSSIRNGYAAGTSKGTSTTARPEKNVDKYDFGKAQKRLRQFSLASPEKSLAVTKAASSLATATRAAVAVSLRPMLGSAGAAVAGNTLGGYGSGSTVSGATDFDGYDYDTDDTSSLWYSPSTCGSGLSYGYWDSAGFYHAPYSSGWGWSVGWSNSWGYNYNWGWNWGLPYSHQYPYHAPGWSDYHSSYYPTVIHHYMYDEPEPVVVNVYADGPVGEAVVNYAPADPTPQAMIPAGTGIALPAPPAPSAPKALSIAAKRYLELGDTAFGQGRYTDSVHFYSRAVDFEPEQGMLHLVLSDALFATGDYHFAAYSLRKALTLEPSLVQTPVDKHGFYADPIQFDRQIATLELFFKANPNDADARLVLGLNLLFGGRPLAAMQLLENAPTSVYGEVDTAVTLILNSARLARWGANPPAEAKW